MSAARSRIGHNQPPSDDALLRPIRLTLYLTTDEDGRPDLSWDGPNDRPIRRLPGRTKSGAVRPLRDYALERAVERFNAQPHAARAAIAAAEPQS